MTVRTIESILKAEGPCLSNRVCQALEADGLAAATARQRIARAGGAVHKLSGLPFPKGVRFMYLDSQRGGRAYWQALVRDAKLASPAYSAALAALLARGGIVPERHFPIVCGSPIGQTGQVSAGAVLERLLAADLVHRTEAVGLGSCISLKDNLFLTAQEDAVLGARLRTEAILLSAVRDWARKLGVASYDAIQTRDSAEGLPRVGTFNWDLAGPSYLRPMVRRDGDGRPIPGFLAADVVVGSTLDEAAVAAFVRKCTIVGGLRKVAPIFPVLVADAFSREAFRLGRSHGVMMATPELLFGREVAEGLAALMHTLTKAAALAVEKPEVVDKIFRSLERIEGAAGNLRGDLFEMLVGHCVAKLDDGSIDIGRKIIDPTTGRGAEIDVFRIKEYREVWSYECKGRSPTQVTTLDDVETWLTTKVPRIHNWAVRQDRFQECSFHYEFWTCGTFASDALQRLAAAKAEIGRYAIGWKDGPDVRKYAARLRPKSVLNMLDQHFFNHPLARIDRQYDAPSNTKALGVETEGGNLLEVGVP